jgi:phosphoglycolate phosphatase-like HAD superfamily hydrolase
VFDVDGTLVDAAELDMQCFDEAFLEVTGLPLPGTRWQRVREFTASAIVKEALSELGDDAIANLEGRIQARFLGKLKRMQEVDKNAFPAAPGGPQLLADLQQSQRCAIAIATGCWRDTSRFKLASAGYQVDGIPFASSSDCYRRVDIILNAIGLAGGTVERAVYIGDQLWDYRAARELGVGFIGVGREREVLRRAGAEVIIEKFSAEAVLHSVLRS